jgi:hypothetical protein
MNALCGVGNPADQFADLPRIRVEVMGVEPEKRPGILRQAEQRQADGHRGPRTADLPRVSGANRVAGVGTRPHPLCCNDPTGRARTGAWSAGAHVLGRATCSPCAERSAFASISRSHRELHHGSCATTRLSAVTEGLRSQLAHKRRLALRQRSDTRPQRFTRREVSVRRRLPSRTLRKKPSPPP